MMCCVRLSNNILKCIKDYAEKYKTLFFLEALFPTIAIKNNLKYSNPSEFDEVTYREFQENNLNKINIFHPVKNLNNHIIFREKI